MKLTVINVGYGDALLLESGRGCTALIDGGSALPTEYEGHPFRIPAANYLAKMGITHLSAVFLTHIHEDHVCGMLPIIKSCTVEHLYVPYPVAPFLEGGQLLPGKSAPRSVPLYAAALNCYMDILRCAVSRAIPITVLNPGDTIAMDETLRIQALAPKKSNVDAYMDILRRAWASDSETGRTALLADLDRTSNGTSLVLKAEGEGMALLTAADSTPEHWDEIPLSLLQNVNVLKLPHHGQADAVDPHIMQKMPLRYVITTASSDRRYNSANAAVYETLSRIAQGDRPQFLFSDERNYAPWFEKTEGFQALTLEMDSGMIHPGFMNT